MISHLLRAIFRRIDAKVDRMAAAALDTDTTAVAEAAGVLRAADEDPLHLAIRAKFAQIDEAVADFARELDAIADDELAEMVEGWSE